MVYENSLYYFRNVSENLKLFQNISPVIKKLMWQNIDLDKEMRKTEKNMASDKKILKKF